MVMLRTIKPKNARSKRALESRAPKVIENPKQAIFVKSSTTSQVVSAALKDLLSLKKPHGIHFSKKTNELRPFDDSSTLEFFSQKNDASLFMVGSHSKKRPHNLVMVRMFDFQVLDMLELGVEGFKGIAEFKGTKCAQGMKPLFIFQGPLFDTHEPLQKLKNMMLDFFRGETDIEQIHLNGLEHVIILTAINETNVAFRVYNIVLKKSGTKLPRVELEEMGPSIDLVLRRNRFADSAMMKEALRVPKELYKTKTKNIEKSIIGDKLGRVHVGRQELDKLQTRKMKGLKKRKGEKEGDEGEERVVKKARA